MLNGTNMNGIRIDLDLSEFFADIRKFSRVYLTCNDNEYLTIRDAEEHIKTTFSINGNIALLSDKYLLPSSQSVNIIQPSEQVRVVRDDSALHDENTTPYINGNNEEESRCAHSTPCCMNMKSECHLKENSELKSKSSKRRRDASETEIDVLSEQVSADKKEKRKKEKHKKWKVETLNSEECSNKYIDTVEDDRTKSKKKLRENDVLLFCDLNKSKSREIESPSYETDRDKLTVQLEQIKRHILISKDSLKETGSEVLDSSVSEIMQNEHVTHSKHKKKKHNDVSNESMYSAQTNVSSFSDAGEDESKRMELSSVSGTADTCKSQDTRTDTEMLNFVPKKSRKRIRKHKHKNKLNAESAKMLYESIRAVGEKKMTTTEELKPEEVKKNVHIFFDDDLGDNMLSVTEGKEPYISKMLHTSNQNVLTNGDSNPEENIMSAAQQKSSVPDITKLPLSSQEITALPLEPKDTVVNKNNKCDSAKIRVNVNGTDKNLEQEQSSGNPLNALQFLICVTDGNKNGVNKKPPVFERKKKAAEVQKCEEVVPQSPTVLQQVMQPLPGIKNTDHVDVEKSKINTSLEHSVKEHSSGLECSSAPDKTEQETTQSEVQKVEPSSAKFDVKLYPVIDKFNPGDAILFKILQLNESYEPYVSGYIFGKVLEVLSEKGSLKLEILRGREEFKDVPSGKFSIYDDIIGETEDSSSNIKEIECNRLIEPRLLYP